MHQIKSNQIAKRKSRKFPLRKNPELVKILLKDRTTRKNIIWASDSYSEYGNGFLPTDNINQKWITNGGSKILQPRIKKHLELQKERTKVRAEVFTPTWIVKKQNDLIEEEIKELSLNEYINYKWLEITCGEAPYMCSRYDATTGKPIGLNERVGFVDRKLQRISSEIDELEEWINYSMKALKSSYGYEFQGDSLFIARENLLYTFYDFYLDKFGESPDNKLLEEIAQIISYNVFQMDGLNYTVPFSEEIVVRHKATQISLFDGFDEELKETTVINKGIKATIKDWSKNKMIRFDSLIEGQ